MISGASDIRESGLAGASAHGELHLAVDTIPGLVWTALPDGHIDFLNRRWLEYTGLKMEQATGWGWETAVHPDDLEALVSYWRSVLTAGAPGETEARLRRHDGVYRWFLFRGVPLYDGPQLVKWYGQTTDIEDLKRAEALLAGEKQVLELVAQNRPLEEILTSVCGLVEELAGDCYCGVVLVDHATARLRHGAAPSLPSSYNDAIHGRPVGPDSGPCAMAAFSKEQVISADVAVETRWDDYAWCPLALSHNLRSCWSTPIVSRSGKVLGAFAIYHERAGTPTEAEQTLIERFTHLASIAIDRAQADDALNQTRTELAYVARVNTFGALTASIAHEVNQPLAGIVTNANTCLRLMGENAPDFEQVRGALQRTVRDANRAAEVIARVRALFQRHRLVAESLSMNDIVRDVVLLTHGECGRAGVSVLEELSPGMPNILGDRVQLQQVLMNLVLNALEAMNGSTTRTRRICIRTQRASDEYVEVSVRDSGVGLQGVNCEKLFEAFVSSKEGGMGMGLAISRSIVERHGGRIIALPNIADGAEFVVSLPVGRVAGD